MVNVIVKDLSQSASSRRGFLVGAAATAAALMIAPRVRAESPVASAAKEFTSFQKRLLGPIYSNPCPFTADLKLDDAGQKKAIARALKQGVGVFACTAGNTKYTTLSFDEVKQVNRVMIEAVGGKALAIAATGDWDTPQAIELSKYSESVGADAVQVLNSQKFRENEDDSFNHFKAVAASVKCPIVLHGKFTDSLLARLAKIENVEAMKEDHTLEDYVRQQIDHGKNMVIFGGGGENRFYIGWPYGAQSYYSTFTTFAPDIAMKVWKTIQSNDIRAAAAMTAKYDYPYIRAFNHGKWHATLELFGLSSRQVRAPHKVCSDEDMAALRKFFLDRGIDPASYRD